MEQLTIKQTALRLGVSDVTIRRMIKRGELTAVQQETPQGFVWMIKLPEAEAPNEPPPSSAQQDETLVLLRETVTMLSRELESRTREVQELHVLLQQAQALALPARALTATEVEH